MCICKSSQLFSLPIPASRRLLSLPLFPAAPRTAASRGKRPAYSKFTFFFNAVNNTDSSTSAFSFSAKSCLSCSCYSRGTAITFFRPGRLCRNRSKAPSLHPCGCSAGQRSTAGICAVSPPPSNPAARIPGISAISPLLKVASSVFCHSLAPLFFLQGYGNGHFSGGG